MARGMRKHESCDYTSPPPLEAEAYALKEALIWLGELGLSRVDI
ncbi:hypothetical protein A2U01_0065438, partial [Trifolium medium]|nr:hypothetical protein [Trifolium medium]